MLEHVDALTTRIESLEVRIGDVIGPFSHFVKRFDEITGVGLLSAQELYGYTVFGKVVSGMDVVNAIKVMPTGAGGPFRSDVPKTPVVIQSATLLK